MHMYSIHVDVALDVRARRPDIDVCISSSRTSLDGAQTSTPSAAASACNWLIVNRAAAHAEGNTNNAHAHMYTQTMRIDATGARHHDTDTPASHRELSQKKRRTCPRRDTRASATRQNSTHTPLGAVPSMYKEGRRGAQILENCCAH